VLEASCALLSVAPDAVPADSVPAQDSGGQAVRVRTYQVDLSPADWQVRSTELAAEAAGVSLATARVVVGGGRGVGGPEGFAALEELAELLGGVVGVSRVVTSQGWRPHRQQVGQTGTKISPELYLACGISGAIQHMAGCQGARHIVVINTDPDAPIVGRAEYAVIGDLNEVVPALIKAIRDRTAG
jgi:electron transfer flavoprotein alpha subunit